MTFSSQATVAPMSVMQVLLSMNNDFQKGSFLGELYDVMARNLGSGLRSHLC